MNWARRLLAGGVERADPVSMEEFGYLLGRGTGTVAASRSGVQVTPNRALGVTAWYSGVRFLSEGVAFLPVHTYRKSGLGDTAKKERRADPVWLSRPDVEMPWQGLVEHWMMSLLHRGNGYAFKIRDGLGQVVGLRELHPDRVRPVVAPDNAKRFVIDGDTERLWTTRDILHIPGLAYNGRVGLNPIQVHAESLGGIVAADEYAHRWFGQGTHVGGVITVAETLTETQATELKAQWDRFHQGLREAHQTGVLGNGAVYNRVSLSAQDAQLLESRQFGVAEVSRMLRIPPHKLYDLSRSTNNNIEHQSIEAVTDGLQPWVERIEAWVNFDEDLMAAGNFVEFEMEGRLRGDTATRYDAYAKAVGRPWLRGNEVRRLENLPPLPELEDVLSPLNMGQADQGRQATVAAESKTEVEMPEQMNGQKAVA